MELIFLKNQQVLYTGGVGNQISVRILEISFDSDTEELIYWVWGETINGQVVEVKAFEYELELDREKLIGYEIGEMVRANGDRGYQIVSYHYDIYQKEYRYTVVDRCSEGLIYWYCHESSFEDDIEPEHNIGDIVQAKASWDGYFHRGQVVGIEGVIITVLHNQESIQIPNRLKYQIEFFYLDRIEWVNTGNVKDENSDRNELVDSLDEKLSNTDWKHKVQRLVDLTNIRDRNIDLDKQITRITPIASGLVPENFKKELLEEIKRNRSTQPKYDVGCLKLTSTPEIMKFIGKINLNKTK